MLHSRRSNKLSCYLLLFFEFSIFSNQQKREPQHGFVSAFIVTSNSAILSNHNRYHTFHESSSIIKTKRSSKEISLTVTSLNLYSIKDFDCINSFQTSKLCLDIKKDETLEGLVSNAYESFYVIDQAIQRFRDCFIQEANDQTMPTRTRIYVTDMNDENEKMMNILNLDKVAVSLHDIKSLSSVLVKPNCRIDLEIFAKKSMYEGAFYCILWSVTQRNIDSEEYTETLKSDTNLRISFSHYCDDGALNPKAVRICCDWPSSFCNDNEMKSIQLYHKMTSLELCHAALTKSIDNSCSTDESYENEIQFIVTQLKVREKSFARI